MIRGIIDFIKGVFAFVVLFIVIKLVFYPFKTDEAQADDRVTYQNAKVVVQNLIEEDSRERIIDNMLELTAEKLNDFMESRDSYEVKQKSNKEEWKRIDYNHKAYVDSVKSGLIKINDIDTTEIYSLLRQYGVEI